MNPRTSRLLLHYGVAIASTGIALFLTLLLEAWMTRTVGAFFYIAVMISTWYGGVRPGMVSIVLSLLAINYYFIPPLRQFWGTAPDDLVRLGIFVMVAFLINLLSNQLREAKRKVETLNQQLQEESADRLKIALEAAQMGMWDWSLVTGKINWSPEHEQLLGLPRGSFDGRYETFDACLHPDDREGLDLTLAHSLQHHVPYRHEFRVIWADGSTHWIEGRGQAFYDETGQPVRMSGTIMAIGERKQAQLLLQQQFEQQRLVMEITTRIRQSLNLQEILQKTVDEVRHFLQVDRVIIFQFTPGWGGTVAVESVVDEALALFPFDIHDPCIGDRYVEPFLQGLVTAKSDIYTADISPCHVEFLAQFQVRANLVVPILKNGELWGLLTAHHCVAPRQWQDSEIDLLRQLASQVSIALQQADLFEQIQTELIERRQVQDSLRESQNQIQQQLAEIETIYQNAPIGLAVLDSELRFVRINQRLAEMNGFTVEVHIGRSVRELLPDLVDTAEQLLRPILETGEPLLNVEITGKTPAQPGVQRVWLESFLPIRDGDASGGQSQHIIGINVVCEEITDRKQAEFALQQFNAELEQRVIERTEELNALNSRLLIALKEQHQAKQEVEDLYNKAPCGYHSLNSEGTIVQINDTELSWLGYTRDQVLNRMKFTDLVTPESQQTFHQNFPKFMQRGWANNLEFQLRHKNGLTRWVNLNATAIRDDAGNFVMTRSSLFDISDRKVIEAEQIQTEAALRESETRFRQLAENIEAVFWMRDGQALKILYVSPAYETIWQKSCASLYRNFSSWIDSILPEDRLHVETAALDLAAVGSYDQEYRILRPDGSIRWIRDRAFSIKDDAGNLWRVAGLAEDITNRKQAEAALQQQMTLEQLRWNITQAIRQSLDLQTILDSATEQMRQTLQVDRVALYRFHPDWSGDFIAESVSDGWVKLVDPDIQKVWEDTYLQKTQGGRFQNNETFVISDIYTAGLQPCHIELLEQFQAKAYAVAPIFLREHLWGLLAIYQNTTARSWHEWETELLQEIADQLAIALQQSTLYNQLQVELQERERANAVIQEAERRWRSLLDNVQLIVVELDHSGHINYINPFFLHLTGYTPSEVLGKNWFENFLPVPKQQTIQTVFSEVLSQNAHPYYQNSILTKSGEERLIAWNNTMLQDIDGTVIGTISIGEDITERHKIDQMKQEFISVVSHELRTPLTSIRGSLGLIAGGVYDKKPEKMKEMIAIAARQSDRLVRLVNDILNLRRLESGQSKFKFQQCSAASLIQQSIDVMRSQAEQNQVTLAIIPTMADIWADADAIVQTLTNLLSNAIKFSPPNSTVTITAMPSPSHTLFSVQDQGRGIPSDHLETIFGQFQQVDASDSREKGGTGLGLAICRTIVKQHSGRIWVESVQEQGSTFYFTLPSTQPSPDNN